MKRELGVKSPPNLADTIGEKLSRYVTIIMEGLKASYPPTGIINLSEINIIHIEEFFYLPSLTPPPPPDPENVVISVGS